MRISGNGQVNDGKVFTLGRLGKYLEYCEVRDFNRDCKTGWFDIILSTDLSDWAPIKKGPKDSEACRRYYDAKESFDISTGAFARVDHLGTYEEISKIIDFLDKTTKVVIRKTIDNHPTQIYSSIRLDVSRKLSSEFAGFLLGNAFKYLWRHTNNGRAEDLQKAKWYLDKFKDDFFVGNYDISSDRLCHKLQRMLTDLANEKKRDEYVLKGRLKC